MSTPFNKHPLVFFLMTSVFLFANSVFCSAAIAGGDTVKLYNGQVVEGKLLDLTGELIRFRTAKGGTTTIKRLEAAGRQDIVQTRGKQVYNGEILYVDPFKLEVETPAGRVRLWRAMVKRVSIGQGK